MDIPNLVKHSYRRNKKGVVGLDIFLSVVVIVFTIGFLVMIFALMGSELEDEAVVSTTLTTTNETLTTVNETRINVAERVRRASNCELLQVQNATAGTVIEAANYTFDGSGCNIRYSGGADAVNNNTAWNVTYITTYDADSTASTVINDTTTSLNATTDWFGIIIVITAMVVLILLTVIIINTIRGTGLISSA